MGSHSIPIKGGKTSQVEHYRLRRTLRVCHRDPANVPSRKTKVYRLEAVSIVVGRVAQRVICKELRVYTKRNGCRSIFCFIEIDPEIVGVRITSSYICGYPDGDVV